MIVNLQKQLPIPYVVHFLKGFIPIKKYFCSCISRFRNILKWFKIKVLVTIIGILLLVVCSEKIVATEDTLSKSGILDEKNKYLSKIEKHILSGITSTAAEIVPYHPRIWLRGPEDWDKDIFGSYAWRIVHGSAKSIKYPSFDHDDLKYIFYNASRIADKFFNDISWHDTHLRLLSLITTGKSVEMRKSWKLPIDLPSTSINPDYTPEHTSDEYYTQAKEKLLFLANSPEDETHSRFIIQVGAAAYDWLISCRKKNDEPVLANKEINRLQNRLIIHAEFLKSRCNGNEHFYRSEEIYDYMYPMVGMALYEPDGHGISSENNAKAKSYLDDFDTYWIGKILPALNEQGGDGGWHGGITRTTGTPGMIGGTHPDNTIPIVVAPFLFAHFTATGRKIEDSVISTGFMKYFIEWQLYMIPPCKPGEATYYSIGGEWQKSNRSPWIFPRVVFARRRMSQDIEQLKLAELGSWLGYRQSIYSIGYGGSWDTQYRLLFEDNWVNPRNPNLLGYGTRHFKQLGWVFMREGFVDPDDVSAIFVCQRFRWSHLDEISQNTIFLGRKDELIRGWDNTIVVDNDGRRNINNFPTIKDGGNKYASGSLYDIGPGIQQYENNVNYTYILGDATNAYDKNKVEKFTREIVFLKPDKFIILDYVTTKRIDFKKSWVIHPGAAPQLVKNSLLHINNRSSALWIKRLLPLDENVNQIVNSNSIEITATEENKTILFLFVLQVTKSNLMKSSSEVVVTHANLISDKDKVGVELDKKKVLFNINEPKGVLITNVKKN